MKNMRREPVNAHSVVQAMAKKAYGARRLSTNSAKSTTCPRSAAAASMRTTWYFSWFITYVAKVVDWTPSPIASMTPPDAEITRAAWV